MGFQDLHFSNSVLSFVDVQSALRHQGLPRSQVRRSHILYYQMSHVPKKSQMLHTVMKTSPLLVDSLPGSGLSAMKLGIAYAYSIDVLAHVPHEQ